MTSGKAKWIDEMVHAMLGSLLQSIKEGKRGENGFKKEAWQKARIATNSIYGTRLDLTQCKTKYTSNEEKDIPTAADGVWDDYITKHPEAAKFRQKPFPFYTEIDEICSGHTATGQYASTPAAAMAERAGQQGGSEVVGTARDTLVALDLVLEPESDGTDRSSQSGMTRIITPGKSKEEKRKEKRVSEETLENPSIIRPKRERNGAGIAIANALEKLSAMAGSAQISKQEEAVRDLQVRFGDIFSLEELVNAMTVMESEIKARIYLGASHELQEKWLRQEIQKLQNSAHSL
ncbi:hypothetical protein HOY80DRAFT_1096226 [Tuber brumale]|nr:hypothetical protein HOY80DRAFT_1096226 [Tuber brumale]